MWNKYARKARQKSGPGVWPRGLKLFSVLIFLVTFCIKTKSNRLRAE